MNTQTSSDHAALQKGGVRFAPSPTGRFHLGNLRTAWISWRFAQELGVPWVVRFEDIDKPRVSAGAADLQLADMASLGLRPTSIVVQSLRVLRHFELFELARASGAIYACNCSRKDVQTALEGLASASHDGHAPVYSGHCRQHPVDASAAGAIAWRFKMPGNGSHDFIIARTNSLASATDINAFTPAYHWACAIDDFDGAYDLIVRSVDLATALPLQRAIQSALPTWELQNTNAARTTNSRLIRAFHTSLVTQDDGHRLEKRTEGVTLHELATNGWPPARLLEAFERSFDSQLLSLQTFNSDGIAREPRETLKLSELLH